MKAPLSAPVAAALLGLALPTLQAGETPDLAKLARAPRKEPAYACKRPLYGLAAFGPKADKAVWLVLDKSKADSARYDVLYIDLDADGDLTGKGERLTAGAEGRFQLAELTDPSTGAKHKEFTLRTEGDGATVMLGVRWRGEFRFGGGYPQDPQDGYMRFAERPADAPVVWLHGDGPFRFQHWCSGRLTIGGADDFKVFLGQPGRGRASFAAAQQHILPAGAYVKAKLVYRDGMGREREAACELRERC
jgi:hypothetical protein